ncbi:hypothetical protein [Oceanicoccus sp. KOV_DT_Chl]|uniref:hypothetical protein n=1 Tax=Oceanicoccus sp. KOV_DT_Chl TaxID=1904639 RepID=UPI0011AFBAF9|nr:hypothetical protein [Oceanicoccus sp. KOV_DT_Chl]
MPLSSYYIAFSLFAVLFAVISCPLTAAAAEVDTVDFSRKQLFENQRNIFLLRKEKNLYIKELAQAKQAFSLNPDDATAANILDIQDSIAVTETVLENISTLITQQRLLLANQERSTPLTALDIALNKALNSNLPELVKNLSNNKDARKEITRLKRLLREQALLSNSSKPEATDGISVATDQQVAEDEFLRLLALFSSGKADDAEDKNIDIAGTIDNTPFTTSEIISYLGHQQYHMETTVYRGQMTFTIDDKPWLLEVNDSDDQATFVIIYDLRSDEPRMVMFNKSLLLE